MRSCVLVGIAIISGDLKIQLIGGFDFQPRARSPIRTGRKRMQRSWKAGDIVNIESQRGIKESLIQQGNRADRIVVLCHDKILVHSQLSDLERNAIAQELLFVPEFPQTSRIREVDQIDLVKVADVDRSEERRVGE